MSNPFSCFNKITPINGLDINNPDNAMQNNYAWSMTELGDYLYVGTARNILYSIFANQVIGDIPPPKELTPNDPVNRGEIWRYKMDGSEEWQRVYTTPDDNNLGFRFMITYTPPGGVPTIYAGALSLPNIPGLSASTLPNFDVPDLFMVQSTDGENWEILDTDILGFSTRYMTEHNGKLYMGALPLMGQADTQLFVTENPANGWEPISVNGNPNSNPRGNVDLLLSFNNHLYVGTGRKEGFELWRTCGIEPEQNNWVLVVDKGAGDARNEHPWAIEVFKNHIYIGTAIEAAVLTLDPDRQLVSPKGFDVIRVDKQDNWELIVGGKPVVPTEPTTGTRGTALSRFSSGFGNFTNAYCWQIRAQGDHLYLGTFSWSVLIPSFIRLLPDIFGDQLTGNPTVDKATILDGIKMLAQQFPKLQYIDFDKLLDALANLITKLGSWTFGFDLWRSRDGVYWFPVSLNGLGNQHNYGVRMLYLAQNGKLYLGTANPFDGLEVWVKPE